MRIVNKIGLSLLLGAALGTAAAAFAVRSPIDGGVGAVSFDDMIAMRELRERSAFDSHGPSGLPLAEIAPRVTLLFVGDVMLSRDVAAKMREHGADYPFAAMRDEILVADIAFGNLETPIVDGPPVGSLGMLFRADTSAATALADTGFDVVSLANNHMMNFGARGLSETVRLLDEVGILHAGAGTDESAALAPAIIERESMRFAFLAFTYDSRGVVYGTVPLNLDLMRQGVKDVREQADFVIVSMHAGTEYATAPNARQVEFAHAAVDAGADLVIGHHPHVVQTAEIYKGKHIFYSLGNFVFDQMWSEATCLGLAVRFTFTKNGVENLEFLPVSIQDYAQPQRVFGVEAESVVGDLGASFLNANTND